MSKQREIRSLTGLRGIAACFIILYHLLAKAHGYQLPMHIIMHGYIAVDLFFVLSGFVMALTSGGDFLSTFSSVNYFKFLYRRLVRIYPLYIVITIVATLLSYARLAPTSLPSPSLLTVLSNVALVQAWGITDSIAGTTWSISTEFAAYLVFPIFVAIMLTRRWTWAWLVSVVSIAILIVVATRSTLELNQVSNGFPIRSGPLDAAGPSTIYPLLRCLSEFALGLLTFRLSRFPIAQRWATRKFSGDYIFILILILLLISDSDIAIVILFVPLIITLATEKSIVARALGCGYLYWLGIISYSLYLVHFLVNSMLREPLTTILISMKIPHTYTVGGMLLILPVFILSIASHYGIEKPCRSFGRKLLEVRPVQNESSQIRLNP